MSIRRCSTNCGADVLKPEPESGPLARALETVALWVAVLGMGVITCAMVAQVMFRYLLNMPLQWSEAISVYALVWVVFPGAAAISFRDEHISIPSLTDLMGYRGRVMSTIIGRLAVIAFAVVVCMLSWSWLTQGTHTMAASLGISTRWIKLALPFGLGLVGLAALLQLADDLVALRRGDTNRFMPSFDGED